MQASWEKHGIDRICSGRRSRIEMGSALAGMSSPALEWLVDLFGKEVSKDGD